MAKEINTAKVKEVFDTMEYDDLIENTKLAKVQELIKVEQ